MFTSKKLGILGPLVLAGLLVSVYVSLSHQHQKASMNVKAYSNVGFDGIQLYKGYFSGGKSQEVNLTGNINTGSGAPDLAVGTSVVIGITSVGSGEVTVNDSRNNTYLLIKSQPIDRYSFVYVFRSILTTPLKAGDLISVHSTDAKSLAASALAFHGVNKVFQTVGNYGTNSSPIGGPLGADSANVFLLVTGLRAKAGDFTESYAPVVQVQSSADSGVSGNSLDNSTVIMDGFVVAQPSTYKVPINLTNLKNKSGYPWATISVSFM